MRSVGQMIDLLCFGGRPRLLACPDSAEILDPVNDTRQRMVGLPGVPALFFARTRLFGGSLSAADSAPVSGSPEAPYAAMRHHKDKDT